MSAEIVELLRWDANFADDFRRLNMEWLERYFRVEAPDRAIFDDPEQQLVLPGGDILFARTAKGIVGTVALKHHGAGDFELVKMAVDPASQGKGLGRKLLIFALSRARELGAASLHLESHSSLQAALALYKSVGFVPAERRTKSPFERCNVYMSYPIAGCDT